MTQHRVAITVTALTTTLAVIAAGYLLLRWLANGDINIP